MWGKTSQRGKTSQSHFKTIFWANNHRSVNRDFFIMVLNLYKFSDVIIMAYKKEEAA